jgi:uncharacterized protein (DUF2147 family)
MRGRGKIQGGTPARARWLRRGLSCRGRGALLAAATLGLTLLLAAPAFGADSIYWSAGNAIRVGNLDGSGSPALFNGETGPQGVAIDPAAGKIYWARSTTDAIRVANLDGTGTASNLFTGESNPRGVAIDPAAGKIYWANVNSGEIRVANLDGSGSASNLFTVESNPFGVAIDPAAGKIYWANLGGNAIRVANLDGSGSAANLFSGENAPEGVAIDPAAGKIYWATVTGGAIRVANLNGTGSAADLFSGELSPVGVAIDPAAGKIYWGVPDAVRVANLDGTGSASNLFVSASAVNFPALLRAPAGTGAPAISGSGQIGSQLSCSQGSWAADKLGSFFYRAPRTFAYRWRRNGSVIPGAAQPTYTVTSPGHYRCVVIARNQAGHDGQASPLRSNKATPTLSTTAALTPSGRVVDRARLTGGFNPTGIITFNLYGPGDSTCSRTPALSQRVRVDGNGTYSSRPRLLTRPGTYRFTAVYHRNANNRAARSPCNAPGEAVTVPSG